jgi:hypothetical protein
MLGAGEVSADVPWFWSDQYELTFQMAGAPPRGEPRSSAMSAQRR